MSTTTLKIRHIIESLKKKANASKYHEMSQLLLSKKPQEGLSLPLVNSFIKLVERDCFSGTEEMFVFCIFVFTLLCTSMYCIGNDT